MRATRPILIWAALAAVIVTPIGVAAMSPLLAWRQPIYIAAGFAGIVALALLLLQPLLSGGYLPGLRLRRGRRVHVWTGAALILAVILHVAGLWLTSPPDVIDALMFRSPTPFSAWGVVAMWAVFAAGLLSCVRARLPVALWRLGHSALVLTTVLGVVIHAMLVEGTMGTASKAVLCTLTLAAAIKTLLAMRSWVVLKHLRA